MKKRNIMKRLWALVPIFFVCVASADTVIISWSPSEEVTGYRVYQYDPEKRMVYEGTDTSYTQEQEESTVFGVAAYNEHGESEIIPRLVHIPKRRPTTVTFTVEVE